MRSMWVLPILVALLAAFPVAAQLPASSTDARAIMQAAHRRDTGDRMQGRLRMTISGRGGGERVRVLRMRQMRGDGVRKTLLLFESPADVRGTGLLTYDYDDGRRADDQWLYLPSLHRTTRIAGQRRSGSFVGSDFSFADFTVADPELYDVRLISGEEEIEGEPAWQIEAVPRSAETRDETGYSKMHLWIGKRTLLALRVKGWMEGGRMKYISLSNVRVVSGIPTAHRIVARTVLSGRTESETVIEQLSISYGDPSVVEDDFTQRRLSLGL